MSTGHKQHIEQREVHLQGEVGRKNQTLRVQLNIFFTFIL